jgi:hypothetical protein
MTQQNDHWEKLTTALLVGAAIVLVGPFAVKMAAMLCGEFVKAASAGWSAGRY